MGRVTTDCGKFIIWWIFILFSFSFFVFFFLAKSKRYIFALFLIFLRFQGFTRQRLESSYRHVIGNKNRNEPTLHLFLKKIYFCCFVVEKRKYKGQKYGKQFTPKGVILFFSWLCSDYSFNIYMLIALLSHTGPSFSFPLCHYSQHSDVMITVYTFYLEKRSSVMTSVTLNLFSADLKNSVCRNGWNPEINVANLY